jgi:acyl-CoA thioester hydrolase
MAKADFSFCFPFRVRYAEVDKQGIVFNAHYLTYFDTTITEYFRALPYDYAGQIDTTGTDFHTVRTVVDYVAPIDFDQDIEVHARAARLGRSSATFLVEIHPAGEDRLLASGEVVWVNADQATNKSAPLPRPFIDAIVAKEGGRVERP